MYRNYILTALRHLFRNKIYSFINIAGLSFGLAAAIELRRSCFATLLLVPNLRLRARLSSFSSRTN